MALAWELQILDFQTWNSGSIPILAVAALARQSIALLFLDGGPSLGIANSRLPEFEFRISDLACLFLDGRVPILHGGPSLVIPNPFQSHYAHPTWPLIQHN